MRADCAELENEQVNKCKHVYRTYARCEIAPAIWEWLLDKITALKTILYSRS